jgi:hypothetical protein
MLINIADDCASSAWRMRRKLAVLRLWEPVSRSTLDRQRMLKDNVQTPVNEHVQIVRNAYFFVFWKYINSKFC